MSPSEETPVIAAPMRDLYRRLKAVGFDRKFLMRAVLPDWWDDSLASVPFNRALAEAAVAQHLGFTVAELRHPEQDLTLPSCVNFCLKRNKNISAEKVKPSVLVARRAAQLVAGELGSLPPYSGPKTASEVRAAILAQHELVDLTALVGYCWDNGIAVLHLAHLPRLGDRFDGVALFCGDRPVIVIASPKDGPPWLAFQLAHEVGHVMRGHVKPGGDLLIDGDMTKDPDDDKQEQEADRFACEVLTDRPLALSFDAVPGLRASGLAKLARNYSKHSKVAAGTYALCYGRSADRWPVAQAALKLLQEDRGGREALARALAKHLPEDLPEGTERFLSILSESAS